MIAGIREKKTKNGHVRGLDEYFQNIIRPTKRNIGSLDEKGTPQYIITRLW